MNIYNIVYSNNFYCDLEEIEAYVATYMPDFLASTMTTINDKIQFIIHNPAIGKTGRVIKTRELIFQDIPYFLVYKIVENKKEIVILNIIHTSRKYP